MDKYNDKLLRYKAMFQLSEEEFPELDKATIVISDGGGKLAVGVKAQCYVMDSSTLFVKTEECGDYIEMSKDGSVSEMLDHIRHLLKEVSGAIELVKKGDKAKAFT